MGLYLDPPDGALVLAVDEKPSIQALERAQGYLKLSNGRALTRVERSLYERANGYSYDAVKIFMPAGAKQPIVVHYTEHCPPDVGAAFIWLKNRDPQHWRKSLRERIEMLCSTPYR